MARMYPNQLSSDTRSDAERRLYAAFRGELDNPRRITLDATDLADLSGWVGRALAYWRGKATQRETAPGEEAVQALMDLLGKAWELRPTLWGEFVQEQEQLIRFVVKTHPARELQLRLSED